MAATPPRSASPVSLPRIPPKPGHPLQISPNLEALLEHDELTRRNSNSPTSALCSASSSEFPGLPPPPPRKVHAPRKSGLREQDPSLPTAQWKKAIGDFWHDALPSSFPPDDIAPAQSIPSPSSRPVTPNPYLNPAPILSPMIIPQPHLDPDGGRTPKPATKTFPNESKSMSSSSRSAARRPSPSDTPTRASNPLHKVEKILWIGRDSLSLLTGAAGGLSKRNDSDRRSDRPDCADADAVQDRQIRHHPQFVSDSRPHSCDLDTATPSSSPGEFCDSPSSCPPSIYSERGLPSDPSSTCPQPLLPRLSLSIMPYDSSRPKSADSVTGHEYLSFIDFFSPSNSDDAHYHTLQDRSRHSSSPRRQPHSISIPPSHYSASLHNISSTSLASMRFAPPSPTTLAVQQPSPIISPANSSSSAALSTMEFAPPSPSVRRTTSSWLQPCPSPPSPYSPLEFAPPPCSPQDAFAKDTLPTPLELAAERGRRLRSGKRSVSLSPRPVHDLPSPLPPTTNELCATERADRIRRNRKLARVFGRVPGVDEVVTDAEEPCVKKSRSPSLAALLTKHKNHRHAVSVSVSSRSSGRQTEPSTPWQTDLLWSPDGRRHSIPLTTDSHALCVDERGKKVSKDSRPRKITDSPESASTTSFIDLSEDEAAEDDDVSSLGFLAPYPLRRRLQQSTSTPSLVDSVDSETPAEADRRRKREKVAKLHRFLGSRVPPEAIIGNVYGPPLPPAAIPEACSRERRPSKHRNAPSDDFDRGKEELGDEEKALNVRRAQKMERVFGTPPPQTLFHTRPSRPNVPVSQPTSPTDHNPYVLTLDISASRNPNQSAYTGKTLHHPGPSDSSRCLLSRGDDTPQDSPSSFADSFAESMSGYQQVLARSSVYLNYQHSLNSLVDIIDRDDRRSLVELYRIFAGLDTSPLEDVDMTLHARRVSASSSLKSERRRSLPSKSSMNSLSSEFYATPKVSQFQIRRRKAAKLTKIFGVDYRELIHDILESIEKGVEEERKTGNLQPQEVEVLMHRVRSLRTLKDPFC